MSMTKQTNPCVLCVRFLGQRTHRLRCSVSVVWDTNYHAFLFCMCTWHGSCGCSSATSSSQAKDNVLAIVLREGDNLRFEPHLLWKLGP